MTDLAAPEPIPFVTTRYACPHCTRTASAKTRIREHMGRCWYNPDAHGCKTCANFRDGDYHAPESCGVGVSLLGGGDARPGPIIGCDKWEAIF
jgi:hypothetical protein